MKATGFFKSKFSLSELEDELNLQGDMKWELVSTFNLDLDSSGKKEVILIFRKEIFS